MLLSTITADLNCLFLLARKILKVKGIEDFRGTGDIDDWFEEFDICVSDGELTERDMIFLLKNLMKDQALTTLKSCSGK